VAGSAEGDVLNIPLPARVPFAVRCVADARGRHSLEVDLYGAHHATTWITHRASARVVREVTAEQAGPQRVRLRVALREPRLWGWRVERTPGGFAHHAAARARCRPPRLAPGRAAHCAGTRPRQRRQPGRRGRHRRARKGHQPLDRGHAQDRTESAGAQVVLVREGDDNPPQRERARRATSHRRSSLSACTPTPPTPATATCAPAGTSTFYKHATGATLAAAVQRRMLEQTGLDDFGLVGNFNYAPMRR
jgi:hypothetical protein